jgi:hypothetical protein
MSFRKRRTQTQLTAPGTTAHIEMSKMRGVKYFSLVCATLNTSVTVRVENTNGTSVVSQGIDQVISTNGTFNIPVFPASSHVRLNFVSEVGGTAATITPTYNEELV